MPPPRDAPRPRTGGHLRIAASGILLRSMNRNSLVGVVAFLVVAGIGTKLSNRQPDVQAQMAREVAAMKAKLPRIIDPMTTQTRVELGDHVIRIGYTVNATFETDEATSDAVKAGLRKQMCAQPEAVKVLGLGYSIDSTYDVPTPHGPGQFHLLMAPQDCSQVTVTRS